MGINIKNPETERLIRELAKLTGEGQTEAVTKAVTERLERVQKRSYGRMRRLTQIAAEMAPLLKDMPSIDEYLYDPETGLPK